MQVRLTNLQMWRGIPPSVLEQQIEDRFVTLCKRRGWLCIKFTPRGDKGWPDRIVIANGMVAFVELKRPHASPTRLQLQKLRRLAIMRAVALWGSNPLVLMAELEANLWRTLCRIPTRCAA